MTRSLRADVRNPLLQLPAAKRLAELPPEAQEALKALLVDIRNDCRVRAEECWRKHKAPMAAYWKATGVYANHAQRLLKGAASTTRGTT
ncbi:hypothetical protein [Piscinibacter gummiphilus]|uniref:Transposase n=1 Tax=Piscinibacter gummiphilus TaxID=946333 RepID=A0ABZ0CND5_9BURK|nr:hypothetical protein [Piscinibacter gummiphilus]WOB06499.1 hypothetical protein RXV79_16375 [Piscinibacter gummiphilus]